MINKITALAFATVLMCCFCFKISAQISSVGFTGEQIFDIVEDKKPAVRFEAAEKFSEIFGG